MYKICRVKKESMDDNDMINSKNDRIQLTSDFSFISRYLPI